MSASRMARKASGLIVKEIHKNYFIMPSRTLYSVLQGVSLEVLPGEICALLGPSGCGKSTLLRVIVGTESSDAGAVLQPEELRELGIVFQNDNCLPWLRVIENVEFGLAMSGLSREQRRNVASDALAQVDLVGKSAQYPGSMSGGEQQRVAFARLLASQKTIWLLDEPFSALDSRTRALMRRILRKQVDLSKTAVLLVTHDLVEAVDLADRILIMSSVPSLIVGRIDHVAELRKDSALVLEAHQFLSGAIGDRELTMPNGRLAEYVTTGLGPKLR